jgi:WhiB family redox-sensing transcriptional regulator
MNDNTESPWPAGESPATNGPTSYHEMAAELDELAAVPTQVLAGWVSARGRCLWEITFGEPPEWSGEHDADRELATRLCTGCPVRAECLEFELRVAGADTLGVWGALTVDDRLALHQVWSSRRRTDIAHSSEAEDDTPNGGEPR